MIRLILVTPEIPANTGNIVRLCAATAVPLHLVEPLGFSLDARLTRRAGLDYWDRCELHRHLTFEELEQRHDRTRFFFLTARAQRSTFEITYRPGDCLVLGPESKGFSERFLDTNRRRDSAVRIPMPGEVRSLNLATAAGIAVYEALRQLGGLAPPEPKE